jgi:hypothetical protein
MMAITNPHPPKTDIFKILEKHPNLEAGLHALVQVYPALKMDYLAELLMTIGQQKSDSAN